MTATPIASSPSSTPTIKRSHSEIGSDTESHIDIPASSKRFTSPLIDLYVGERKYHYTVHEAFLYQSHELKNLHELTAKKSRKGTILNLPRENPKEIGQVIEYLYFNDLVLMAKEPQARLDELLTVWKTATQFSVAGMKRQVVQRLDTLSLAEKVPALKFIKVADQMYECDIDTDLRMYFNKVAPTVVRKIMSSDRRFLDDMIEEGGSFAADLFSAYRRAFELPSEPSKSAAVVKSESQAQLAKRARIDTPNVMLVPVAAQLGPMDNRTVWDKQNNIPALWATVNEADRLVVSLVGAGKGWNTILEAVQQKTGEKASIATLLTRYNRLEANILRVTSDDSDLLAAAQSEIETEFKESAEWPLVAARLIQKGGRGYEPMRLRYHCAAFDAANQATVATSSAAVTLSGSETVQIKTEVIGGVRVDNSKAINIQRRRRPNQLTSSRSSSGVITRRPAQARKKVKPAPAQQEVESLHSSSGGEANSSARLLRTRSKRTLTKGQGIDHGNSNGNATDGSAATATVGSGSVIEGTPMLDQGSPANNQPEPIAIRDSDEEDL
ncbi:MAG: hypothetical protein Q9209_005963 [Squamulea sp. 1 TL-2023]